MADELAPFVLKAPRDTVLFREGETGNEMYFIHSGRVRIEKNVDGATEVLAVMEKGDFFGEMVVIDAVPRSATAIVEEDAELLKVDTSNFEKLLKGNIEIAIRMIRKYAARLRETNDRLQALLRDRKEMDQGIQEILQSVKTQTQPKVAPPQASLAAQLVGEGTTFAIRNATTLIGRKDPVTEIVPDVDLTDLDKHRSVSRRHARLEQIDGRLHVVEEVGVSNGTTVNGKRLKAGEPAPVSEGDVLTFGKVSFVLRLTSSER